MTPLKKARKIVLLALILMLSTSLALTGIHTIVLGSQSGVANSEIQELSSPVDIDPAYDDLDLGPGTIELKYDDGIIDAREWWLDAGGMYAVRFTPTDSGQLTSCKFYIHNNPANFKVHVMNAGKSDIITPFTVTPTSTGWFNVDLSAHSISVSSGVDFYIGMEWMEVGTHDDGYPELGADTSSPDDRSWGWNGVDWTQYTDRDHMIRATIETGIPGAREWTYMVYQDGDNNLEESEIETFLMMASVGSTSSVDIVTQMDRTTGYDDRYGDWTDCKRFHVTAGLTPIPANAEQDLGEVNMGDPGTLTDFVNWAVSNYPANHYCLVLSDHGSGTVQVYGEGVVPQGVCFDDTSGGDCLTTTELRSALSGVGTTMDVLFFDACLMGMTGVAYEIADYANYMVGSEETSWGPGPYDDYLSALVANPLMSPGDFASHIVTTYINWISPYGYPVTMSAVNLAGICLSPLNGPHLITSVSNLAQELTNKMSTYHTEISTARSNAEGYEGPYAGWSGYYIDLYHFAELIYDGITDSAIRSYATDVMVDIANVVIEEGHSNHPNSHGLSIFFPETEEKYTNYNFDTTFKGTMFAADTQWDEFLEAYYAGPPPTYDVTITAYCLSTSSYVSVNVRMNGGSWYSTPHTFSDLTGSHDFEVDSTDPHGCPFTYWDDGHTLTSPTRTISSGGTYQADYGAPVIHTFADLRDLFVPGGEFIGTFVYGDSFPHTLWMSRTIDVAGATYVALAFDSWGTPASLSVMLDVEVYDEAAEDFLPEFRGVPLIPVGGPGVNWGWWHWNHYYYQASTESPLWAWFVYVDGHGEVWTYTGNHYAEYGDYSYAIIQLHWDAVNDRPVLPIAGICGPAGRGASLWLAERMLEDSILTDPTLKDCVAFVLRVNRYDYTDVTVEEYIQPP